MNTSSLPVIGVIGGTGDLGRGLCLRSAAAGYSVILGSRSAENAANTTLELTQQAKRTSITGADYAEAAKRADIILLAIPYAAHAATLEKIKPYCDGKLVVDATVPLKPPKVMRVQLPEEGTAAEQTQRFLGHNVKVTAAFHSVAAAKLSDLNADPDCDILVFGDDPEARESVISLARAMGLKAWHAGPLANAVIGEALTSTLIFINKKYKINGAGIRITGKPS